MQKENEITEDISVLENTISPPTVETVDLESTVKTEVTSIAMEEAKTGQKIKMPSAEDLVQRASLSLVQSLQQIDLLISTRDPIRKLSNKGIKRALLAGLQLPIDGVPVALKKNQEKHLFGLIQRIISDRFIILQHHISQEIKKERESKAKEQTDPKEDSNE